MTVKRPRRESVLLPFDCACATVRRTARLVTQLYDEELRPHIEVPQFALLSVLEQNPCSQARLARDAGFDKTTISRNLALMRRKGWVEEAPSDDGRDRHVRITSAGRHVLHAARPGWNRAQERLSSAMTRQEWEQMWPVLDRLTNAALRARERKPARSKRSQTR